VPASLSCSIGRLLRQLLQVARRGSSRVVAQPGGLWRLRGHLARGRRRAAAATAALGCCCCCCCCCRCCMRRTEEPHAGDWLDHARPQAARQPPCSALGHLTVFMLPAPHQSCEAGPDEVRWDAGLQLSQHWPCSGRG
jgi:hypothetical protein